MAQLSRTILIDAPIERCFDLTRSVDFHADAAQSIKGQAVGGRTRGLSEDGDSTWWRATFFGLNFRLATQIQGYARPSSFRDVMTHGLFKRFCHEYRFSSLDNRTRLEDTFVFESPFGFLGSLLDRWLLLRPMRLAQDERLQAIKSALEQGEADRYLST